MLWRELSKLKVVWEVVISPGPLNGAVKWDAASRKQAGVTVANARAAWRTRKEPVQPQVVLQKTNGLVLTGTPVA